VKIKSTQSRTPTLRGVRPAGAGARARPAGAPEPEQRKIDRRHEPRSTGAAEQVTITFRQREHRVALLNVSRTGVMVAAEFLPKVGERLQIAFEGCNPTRCMVRWIRNGRIGLEFVKETTLLVPVDWKRELNGGRRDGELPTAAAPSPEPVGAKAPILAALEPVAAAPEPAAAPAEPNAPPGKTARPARERVLWPCELFWDGGSSEVGLRNISEQGAMVAGFRNLKPGTEVVLALKSAGSIAGAVRWCRAGQVGIHFERRFDVAKLVDPRKLVRPKPSSRPGIVKPQYLETELEPDSPWAACWDKLEPRDFR
jgi:hypothetical protein